MTKTVKNQIYFVLSVMLFYIFVVGWFMGIFNRPKSNKKDTDDKVSPMLSSTQAIRVAGFLLVFGCAAMAIFQYNSGYNAAETTTSFKIILPENGYAVVYETDGEYFLSPCKIENDEVVDIDKNRHKIISKLDVEYTIKMTDGKKLT